MNRKVLVLYAAMAAGVALVVGLVSACQAQADTRIRPAGSVGGPDWTSEIIPTAAVWEMLGEISPTRALHDLRRLTGEEPICALSPCYTVTNRLTGGAGSQATTTYISHELTSLGYAVRFEDWSRNGRADRNVIVTKPGVYSPTEEVYVVAHVDGVGTGDLSFPSADDDGSGAVANLELARILSSHEFSRTLVLLFTTGEEQGHYGATSHVSRLSPQELASVKYAVSIDMVGYDANRDGVMELWPGNHPPSVALTQIMSATIRAYQLQLTPRIVAGCT